MNEKTNSQVLVIGLGGCGGQIINSIQESEVDHITCIHLDSDSEIFGDFFFGYMHEVGNKILQGIQISRSELLTVIDVNDRSLVPLSDLPDIFMRCTSRPLMRASLLLLRERISTHLEEKITSPTKVHITCSTSGWTGSGWVLDIAVMVRKLLPSTPIQISLVNDDPQFGFERPSSWNCKIYWTLREFLACSDPTIPMKIEPSMEKAVLSIIPSEEEIQIPDTNVDANELITSVLKEISIHTLHTIGQDFFWRERSRTVSDLITNETKNLIAGYMLACAEGRSNGFRRERYFEFSSQQTKNSYRINFVVKNASSGSEYSSLSISRGYGLAIIPYESWDELQVEAFQKICVEGLSARSGQASNLSVEARASLISLKDHFLNSIDQLSIIRDKFHAKNYADVLPHYVAIANEILANNS